MKLTPEIELGSECVEVTLGEQGRCDEMRYEESETTLHAAGSAFRRFALGWVLHLRQNPPQ